MEGLYYIYRQFHLMVATFYLQYVAHKLEQDQQTGTKSPFVMVWLIKTQKEPMIFVKLCRNNKAPTESSVLKFGIQSHSPWWELLGIIEAHIWFFGRRIWEQTRSNWINSYNGCLNEIGSFPPLFIKHIEELNLLSLIGEDFIFSNKISSFLDTIPYFLNKWCSPKEVISLNWLLEVVAKPKGTRDGVLQC